MEYHELLLNSVAAAALGYLLGSVPFAVVVSKVFGLADPRSHGSGNPGATNVLRTGSKAAAALTLLGDAGKGWLAMWIATAVGAGETAIGIAGVAAFIGHVYPVTLGFRGGKGVATALGVMLGFSTTLAGIVVAIWLAVAVTTRYSSLAALVAAFLAPFIAWLVAEKLVIALPITIMSAILIFRHKSNIAKLFAGTESRIGAGRKSAK